MDDQVKPGDGGDVQRHVAPAISPHTPPSARGNRPWPWPRERDTGPHRRPRSPARTVSRRSPDVAHGIDHGCTGARRSPRAVHQSLSVSPRRLAVRGCSSNNPAPDSPSSAPTFALGHKRRLAPARCERAQRRDVMLEKARPDPLAGDRAP